MTSGLTHPRAQAPSVEVARPVLATVCGTARQEQALARGHHRADYRAGGIGRELLGVDEDELLQLGHSNAHDVAGKGHVEHGD
jgi:hypothetical protein